MTTNQSNLPKSEESALPSTSASSHPPRRLFMPFVVGAVSATGFLALAIGIWLILQDTSGPKSPSPTTVSEPIKPEPKQTAATMAYWNALIECDKRLAATTQALQNDAKSAESPSSTFQGQVRIATGWANALRNFVTQASQLPMLDVDDDLLRHVREEIRISQKAASHFENIANSASAVIEWSSRQNTLSENSWTDLLDSFLGGLSGRPFAGYEKVQAKFANFDAEGKALIQQFLLQCQAYDANVGPDADAHDVSEVELRAILTKRFGVEFPVR